MVREQINTRKRYFVKKLNNFICNHCKEKKISEELELDHIVPISNGGTNDYLNLQCLCIDCHSKKTQGEWKEGYGVEKNIELTPEESLEILKEYLEENKDKTYPDIQFLILNHKILSKFFYNTTTLGLLYNQARGTDMKNGGAVKYREQRDLMIYILRKTLKLSYKKIEGILNDFEFEISYVQIRNICAKFGEKETKEDEQDIKNKKKDLEEEEDEDEIDLKEVKGIEEEEEIEEIN